MSDKHIAKTKGNIILGIIIIGGIAIQINAIFYNSLINFGIGFLIALVSILKLEEVERKKEDLKTPL